MTDLRTRILAEIDRREQIAREATDSPWRAEDFDGKFPGVWFSDDPDEPRGIDTDTVADAVHIALHDPADALRRYAAARRVVERHVSVDPYDLRCRQCYPGSPWPCTELLDLAASLGIDATTPDGAS